MRELHPNPNRISKTLERSLKRLESTQHDIEIEKGTLGLRIKTRVGQSIREIAEEVVLPATIIIDRQPLHPNSDMLVTTVLNTKTREIHFATERTDVQPRIAKHEEWLKYGSKALESLKSELDQQGITVEKTSGSSSDY